MRRRGRVTAPAAAPGEFDLYEPFGAAAYGWLLLGSMAAVVGAALALTARQECRGRRFRGGMLAAAHGQFDALELRERAGPAEAAAGAPAAADYRRSQVWPGARGAELPASGLLEAAPRGGGGPGPARAGEAAAGAEAAAGGAGTR
jgi:hypothetical protein